MNAVLFSTSDVSTSMNKFMLYFRHITVNNSVQMELGLVGALNPFALNHTSVCIVVHMVHCFNG